MKVSLNFFLFLSLTLTGLNLADCDEKSPFISENAWEKIKPYLLPTDHPAKTALDEIFNHYRATSSHKEMKRAGFSFKLPRGDRRATVAKHKKIKGYLIKTYLDTQNTDGKEWKAWIQRIKGAECIQASIDKHGFNHLAKTPKKWIYPLPTVTTGEEGPFRKNFILVVENMHILSNTKNRIKYQESINKERMKALYILLTENLLIDSIYLDNIPFSKDGKIAFIDTEHYLTTLRPLKLHRMTKFFSPIMQEYWEQLITGKIDVTKTTF